MSLKTIHKGSKAKKGPRSLKISPIWSRIEWPLTYLNKRIDRLCCAVHNLSIRLLRTVWGYTILPQKWYCDKWDFAGIRANQNVSIRKLKMGTFFFNACKIYFFETLNLAFKMAFLHGSLNQMVYFFTRNLGLYKNPCEKSVRYLSIPLFLLRWVSSWLPFTVDQGFIWFMVILSKGKPTWHSPIGCGVSFESSWWARFHGRPQTYADWVWYFYFGIII